MPDGKEDKLIDELILKFRDNKISAEDFIQILEKREIRKADMLDFMSGYLNKKSLTISLEKLKEFHDSLTMLLSKEIQERDKKNKIIGLLEKKGFVKLENIDSHLERIIKQEIRSLERITEPSERISFLNVMAVSIDNFSDVQEFGEKISNDVILELASLFREELLRVEDTICFDSNFTDYYMILITRYPDEVKIPALRISKGIYNHLFKSIVKAQLEKQRKKFEPLIKTDIEEEIKRRLEQIKNEYVKFGPEDEKKMKGIVRQRVEREKEQAEKMFKDIVNALQLNKFQEIINKYPKNIKSLRLSVSIGISLPSEIRADKEYWQKIQNPYFFNNLAALYVESAACVCLKAQEKGGNSIFKRLASVKVEGEYPCVEIKE